MEVDCAVLVRFPVRTSLIADYDTAGALVNRYIHGGLDETLIQVAAGGTISFIHHDNQNSVVAISDNSGVVISQYSYSPWGESAALTGTTFGYTGQRYDAESGLYYFKARHLNVSIGRFLQCDPIGYLGGYHLFQYADNDPLSKTDSFGLVPQKPVPIKKEAGPDFKDAPKTKDSSPKSPDVFDTDWREKNNYKGNSTPDLPEDPNALKFEAEIQAKVEIYEVKKKDTLWDLAKSRYGDATKWPVIYEANKQLIDDPHWIYPGQKFVIPELTPDNESKTQQPPTKTNDPPTFDLPDNSPIEYH